MFEFKTVKTVLRARAVGGLLLRSFLNTETRRHGDTKECAKIETATRMYVSGGLKNSIGMVGIGM